MSFSNSKTTSSVVTRKEGPASLQVKSAHHIVVGFTDDAGVEAFGRTFQRPRLGFVGCFV